MQAVHGSAAGRPSSTFRDWWRLFGLWPNSFQEDHQASGGLMSASLQRTQRHSCKFSRLQDLGAQEWLAVLDRRPARSVGFSLSTYHSAEESRKRLFSASRASVLLTWGFHTPDKITKTAHFNFSTLCRSVMVSREIGSGVEGCASPTEDSPYSTALAPWSQILETQT